MKTVSHQREKIRQELAGAFTVIFSGALYIASMGTWGAGILIAVRATGLSGAGAAFALLLALAGGCITGIFLNYALTPIYLRWNFGKPSNRGASLSKFVSLCMEDSGIANLDVFVLRSETEAWAGADIRAMVGGVLSFPRSLRRTLFISEGCSQALNPDELRALVMHELSHIRLSHLSRRLCFSFVALIGLLTLGTIALLLCAIFGLTDATTWLSPLIGSLAFFVAFRGLRSQCRRQELEADAFAVTALRADAQSLANVILKSSRLALGFKPIRRKLGQALGMETHPDPELRMEALKSRGILRDKTPSAAA